MIIVTGANGKLGRLVVESLLRRVAADRVAVSVRDPQQAAALAERGVRVRRGDFDDPASLAAAFEGASQVLVVSSNTAGDAAVRHHRTAIEVAVAAGARRIAYTSHVGASATSAFAPMRDHFATEAILRESGVAFTALRNGFYADSAMLLLGGALGTGTLSAPADGPVSWTAHADLAEAAAIVLADAGPFESATLELTATEAIDLAGVAGLVSALTGREIRRVVVDDAAHRDAMIARGIPTARAEMLLGMFAASRRGDFATVSPRLGELLGRDPIGLRDGLGAMLATAGPS